MSIVKNRDGNGTRLLEIDSISDSVPNLNADNCYLSYFECPSGKQFLFCGDNSTIGDETFKATVYVNNTAYQVDWNEPCPLVPLSKIEQVWLIGCWMAFADIECYQQVVDQLNKHVKKHLLEQKDDNN